MKQPTHREIASAIIVLQALSRKLDDADSEEARRNAPESSMDRHERLNKSRLVERLASIEESVAELRCWEQEINHSQSTRYGHGYSV